MCDVLLGLNLSQTNIFFYSSEMKECLQTTISNGRKFFIREENTVGKTKIARYEQFLLFPQCFQKTCTVDT